MVKSFITSRQGLFWTVWYICSYARTNEFLETLNLTTLLSCETTMRIFYRTDKKGLSEPDFYGDLVYKLKKIVGSNNFSAQFIKIIFHYKKIGYNSNVLQQTACLVVNPITVGNFAFLFNCTPVGRTSDSMMVPT